MNIKILAIRVLLMCLIPIGTLTAIAEDRLPTLDSEIDRLSIQYNVSSSTVRSVIRCESQLYGAAVNHNKDKNGKIWSSDFGFLQINDYWHEKTMDKLGLDIHNQWESLEYGFMLMSSSGLKPWKASEKCWGKSIK